MYFIKTFRKRHFDAKSASIRRCGVDLYCVVSKGSKWGRVFGRIIFMGRTFSSKNDFGNKGSDDRIDKFNTARPHPSPTYCDSAEFVFSSPFPHIILLHTRTQWLIFGSQKSIYIKYGLNANDL